MQNNVAPGRIISNSDRISISSKVILLLSKLFAPDFKSQGSAELAIAKDRKVGPAYPPKELMRKIYFEEKTTNTVKSFG